LHTDYKYIDKDILMVKKVHNSMQEYKVYTNIVIIYNILVYNVGLQILI